MRTVLAGRWLSVLGLVLSACALPSYSLDPSLDNDGGGSSGTSAQSGSAGNSATGGDSALGGNNPTGGDPTGGSNQAGGNPQAGAATDGGAGPSELSPLPGELRRLTASEYEASVSDTLGTSLKPDLAEFSKVVDGFDNNAAANSIDEELYVRYIETAEALADEVFSKPALNALVITCATTDDSACVRSIVDSVGLRLFRRPLLAKETDGYEAVYTRARVRKLAHAGALQEVLTALLVSAQFLYRTEFVPTEAGVQPIGSYDMASRLSYLLWGSAPDVKLLDDAKNDALSSDQQLTDSVERLLADPKSSRFVESFAGQWLGARDVRKLMFDAPTYPAWTLPVANAAASEIQGYFDEFLRKDLDFGSFFDSPVHFVDSGLDNIYGVAGQGPRRVELQGQDRQGFLGLVGFLAQTSRPTRTSPSARGSWIWQRLLCEELDTLPDQMPAYDGQPDALRTYLFTEIKGQPACNACHALIDPLGVALEKYDAIGRYRTTYPSAVPVDASAMLTLAALSPDPIALDGVKSVSDAVGNSTAFRACVARKLYTFGMGRGYATAERANMEALSEQWQAGSLTMKELVMKLVESPAFRARSDGGAL